jgi:hypothetical protein
MSDQQEPTQFRAQIRIECPFCNGVADAGEDSDGLPGVVHTLPTCTQFEQLEPDEYLRAVRLRLSE